MFVPDHGVLLICWLVPGQYGNYIQGVKTQLVRQCLMGLITWGTRQIPATWYPSRGALVIDCLLALVYHLVKQQIKIFYAQLNS